MPDLSQYSPDKPFVPQFFQTVNLSDVFTPSVTLPEVNKPSRVNGFGQGDSAWSFFLNKTKSNPFAGLGVVPTGPAAVDDYWSNRKFTSEADSYQLSSTYKDIGFLIGRDNEDLFSKNLSGFNETINTATRLLGKAGAYTVQGFGFLGGLVGLGNKHNNYSSGSEFMNWIAGASDNALATWGKEASDRLDNFYTPLYQEAADRDKGFFSRMLTDSEFWKGDAIDLTAFLASAYMTGGVSRILGLGEKVIKASAAYRGLNFADEAVALSDEGLSGLSASTVLSGGATIAETGAPLVPNVFAANAGKLANGFIREAGNFANANKINMGVGTLLNTASESMFEASHLKDEMADRLSAEKNADGTAKYSPEEVKNITARAATNSFGLNMAALFIPNLWEMKMFFGKAARTSARNLANPLIRREAGLLSTAEVAKRTFGQKGLDYLKSSGTGIVNEGLFQENIQLAIERINKDEENIDIGFFRNIGKVLNQYGSQTIAALSGNDQEAALNIGLGGLAGGGIGIQGRFKEIKAVKRDVANFNAAINSFKKSARDLYEKNEDGSIRLDNNQQPVISGTNVLSYIASLNKTLNMSELADNLKDKNMDILHSIVDNENISRLVKAYADSGMIDNLISKLDNAQGYKTEDLMLLGLNPDKASVTPRLEEIKKKATQYKNIYDNIEKNFFVNLRNDDKQGSKARAMKDKLYYLSTRAANLSELQQKVDSRKEASSTEISTRYAAASDSIVDRLNELYTNYNSAKKRERYLSTEQRRIGNGQLALPESEEEVISIGDGNSLTRKKKGRRAQQEQFTGVEEQDLSDAVSAVTEAEKELAAFLEDNKDAIKNIKKNADGSFRYEIPEKNRLMYDAGVVKDQNISKDLEMARNATLNVFNRLSDIKYGERYFDQVYSKRKQVLQDEVVNDESDEVDENLEDEPTPPSPPAGPDGTVRTEPIIQSRDDEKAAVDELSNLKKEKEIIETNEEATLEDEVRLDEINKRIEELEETFEAFDNAKVEDVNYSDNIPLERKEDYKKVLLEIEKNKRRVVKKDGYYEVDGERYGKVSDLIGNVVPEELRASLSNALAAGYTVDSIVKAYFEGGLSEDFKREISTKISEEAYTRLIKQLDVVRDKLRNDGIEIVATNVVTWDSNLKVAGEIDILGVDAKGNFKVYEIEARQGRVWAQIATRSGRGPAIYEMSQKQLSAYRNLFANQYGHVPNSISVMFPIDVKYDKENPSGFIEKVNLKKEIRYTPTANVQIKSNIFQPVRIGSKYDGFDMTSLYINSFIPKALDIAKEKLRFLLRNETFDKIKKGLVINVKEAEESFQELFADQQRVLSGKSVDGRKITPIPNAPNLYALRGNKEISLTYNGQLLGYMQPSPTLVYKDEADKFHVLDENTDIETYKTVTGNSETTYPEFVNISKGYKVAYHNLVDRLGKPINIEQRRRDIRNAIRKAVDAKLVLVDNSEVGARVETLSNLGNSIQTSNGEVDLDVIKKVIATGDVNEYGTNKPLSKKGEVLYNAELAEAKEVTLSNAEVQSLFEIQMSYGELDLVNVGQPRTDLGDLVVNGVKVGGKSVVTVVHIDQNDAVRVIMDKNTRTKSTGNKLYEIDRWANTNLQTLKNALNNKRGEKVADFLAVVETPDGKFHPIALRLKKDAIVNETDDYIKDLGSKFTSATTKNVFKNESISLIPKKHEPEINIPLKGENIVSDIYTAEDINSLEKIGLDINDSLSNQPVDVVVNDFVKELGELEFKKINSMFAAYELSKDELVNELLDDFNAGTWSSVDDYIENIKCEL